MNKIPIIINLPQSIERKETVAKRLEGMFDSHIVLEAVDGARLKDLAYSEKIGKILDIPSTKVHSSYFMDRKNFQSYNRDEDIVLAKAGCFLSHMVAINFALTENLSNILILEDDFKILNKNIKNIEIKPDSLITYFGGQSTIEVPANDGFLSLEKYELLGTYGYGVGCRNQLTTLFNLMKSVFNDGIGRIKLKDDFNPIKDRLKMMSIDLFYKKFIHSKCVLACPPSIGHNDEVESTISNTKKYKKRYGNKCISKLINDSEGNINLSISGKAVNHTQAVVI
tara:strand:+ start:3042 stop:3887 length:846 start_codon:yes stop_codon:yes gene_type:complete